MRTGVVEKATVAEDRGCCETPNLLTVSEIRACIVSEMARVDRETDMLLG